MKSIICLGPCCSGKTTWSFNKVKDDKDYIRFSIDEFRIMTTGSLSCSRLDGRYMQLLYNFTLSLHNQHRNLVLDNLPIEPQWLSMAVSVPQEVDIKLFDVDFKESLLRNNLRRSQGNHFIKPSEMHRYYLKYIEFINSKAFKEISNKENVTIICDDFVNINKQFIG